ncbi:MAG: FAD-binding oxidoreductase [Gemmatimonadaceae bacterium]|nr:FAD-binding oxidoreductase [Gemmatimonadaceae bacterium]
MSPVAAPAGFRGTFRDDDFARAMYSESAGIARIIPVAVAIPVDHDDLALLVRWAAHEGVALIPRGSASSMANGAVGPGVVVDLRRFDTIGKVDVERGTLIVGAAVLRNAADDAAARFRLSFPVDPSSGAFCTIGGMCATNAAGSRSVRVGAMRAWVHGVECVFADGERVWLRRGETPPALRTVRRVVDALAGRLRIGDPALSHVGVRKESSGYALAEYARTGDLVDLLVGSEGTLAFITAVELRLTPALPATASMLAAFPTLEDAAEAAGRLAVRDARAVELLDRTFLDVCRATAEGRALLEGVPDETEAVLLVEAADLYEVRASDQARALGQAAAEAGASAVRVASDNRDELAMWRLRHAASPILSQLDPHLASMQVIEDACVPPARFPTYIRGVRELAERHGLRVVMFGHAGDAHAHVNLLVDTRRAGWRDQVAEMLDDVSAFVASLGGTLAGEHGDGRLRTPLLDLVWPEETRELFRLVKTAFDPVGILNPGVKIPLRDALPFDAVKYDPTLPPLPAEARLALDAIAADKGWARARLPEE